MSNEKFEKIIDSITSKMNLFIEVCDVINKAMDKFTEYSVADLYLENLNMFASQFVSVDYWYDFGLSEILRFYEKPHNYLREINTMKLYDIVLQEVKDIDNFIFFLFAEIEDKAIEVRYIFEFVSEKIIDLEDDLKFYTK